jgi:predicted CopG family antitoxin
MAAKGITIDLDAYEALSRRLKRKGQSFSHVIKERFGRRKTARDLLAALGTAKVSEETLDNIDRQVKLRRRNVAKAPKL